VVSLVLTFIVSYLLIGNFVARRQGATRTCGGSSR
jgi:hypothetical protein